MKIGIKNRVGVSLYNGEGEDLKSVLVAAVKNGADLRGADLRGADLGGADLGDADLRGADLRGADLGGADLGDEFPSHLFRICAEGTIIGYKKLACGRILKLEIPADAGRMNSLNSRKCRASYVIPLAVLDTKGDVIAEPGDLVSRHKADFKYEIGVECHPDKYDENIREECSGGIHFFITFEEARDY